MLFEDKVVLQCDQKQGGFLVQLNVADGEEIWRTSREPIATQSWATPAVVRAAARTQIVSNGWPYIAGYDFANGKELWRLKSPGDIPVPTPIFANGLIYVTNAHSGPTPLFAIKPDAHGDISPQGTATSDQRWSCLVRTAQRRVHAEATLDMLTDLSCSTVLWCQSLTRALCREIIRNA